MLGRSLGARRAADVAVYAPHATALYRGGEAAGGAELQMTYVARALAYAGLRVVHLVFDDGRPLPPRVEGVLIVRLPAEASSGNALSRRRAVAAGLRRADAAVYIQRSAGMATGLAASVARLKRRAFVYSSSSGRDFVDGNLETVRARLEYRLGLRLANCVVVQTKSQRERARAAFGLDAIVIPSFCEVAPAQQRQPEVFVWIGRIVGYKNPLAYVALAERIPEARFVMVAQSSSALGLQAAVRAAAERLANLELVGPIAHSEALALYGRSVAVVNTSDFEGFPNTFLEGWARGVPALSLRVDPDGVIERHGLGVVVGSSEEKLAEAARELWQRRNDLQAFEAASRLYVEHAHAPIAVGAAWSKLVAQLL